MSTGRVTLWFGAGQTLQNDHPGALLSHFNAPGIESKQREMAAYATIEATKAFRQSHIDDFARQSHVQKISLRRTALETLCPVRDPPTCMPASKRYRTHDGTCNNKRRPRWGASQMPFNRFLPPEYGDGVDSVRSSSDGSTLSSARFVSLLVHGARDGEAPLTMMIAQWGQLLDHDMTSTAQPRSINGSVPSCCGGQDFHPSCFPIKVPLDDPWLSPLKVRCLEFLRSAPAQRRDCVLSWREQTNQATSFIDASPIYSNNARSSDSARIFRNGLLVYGRGNLADDVCHRGAIAAHCIRSGDGRSGEQPGLLAMHLVWVGEHNRISLNLSDLNPHWSDEKLYQETRRIIGAMFQHITYREFLPIILGREVCKLFDLELLDSGYYNGYDAKVNPTIANAFSSAAFRFGHSLVQSSYTRCDRHHNIIRNNISLHEEFQKGDIGSAGSLHRLLRGLASQRALKRDEFITPELTNHLFQTPSFPFGLDLAAINIQRGRDHGLAPYTSWRVPCGLTPILSWNDFANAVGPESARRIGHAYRSVHDIDLFVGGIAERPVIGGLVGPTFACIIAQQFSNTRRGDRFWYENGGFESSFTPAQLHSLRSVSLAQVLCRSVGGGTLQPHIFVPHEFMDNERQSCGSGVLGDIDLSPWLEQDLLSEQDFKMAYPNINGSFFKPNPNY
ncbi:CG42331 [Drosophila busckii]|uniref:CG42331 n=1 Tax=Drosophila busckii TaxID=30019 RepID=A0A0M4ERS2_DROBS|nr:CG42331 [Drosophila busckii]